MSFVIDASATLPWRFADEATLWSEALLDRVEAGEEVVVPAQWPAILSLAQQHRLTAYDAAYLDLAQRTGLPLATLDGDLRKATAAAGGELVELAP